MPAQDTSCECLRGLLIRPEFPMTRGPVAWGTVRREESGWKIKTRARFVFGRHSNHVGLARPLLNSLVVS